MTPYLHQKAAIKAAASALATSDRCRVTMACGTGKTETAAWSAVGVGQAEVNTRVVVGVPSLNLIDQTWRRWAGMFKMPPAMAVCSDERVGREVFHVSDYGLPRTSTDPAEIARFLAVGGPCVVFCTYQSAERLAVAMDAPGVAPFDFAICDEAHRLTGKGSQGAAFLAADRIRATRRTFWTATPRIVRGEDVISMDDVSQFGPSAYTYAFCEAIRDGRLSQFQIVAVQVDDPRVSDALASDKGVEDAAVVVAVAKAMRDYGLRRVISFHSRVKRAAAFAAALPGVCASLPDEHRIEGVYANHIHAGTPMDQRRKELARLRSADGFTLLSNAQCLGEGVDVPELDGIVFADPRTSQIEIWQAIGRAIRKSDAGKVATVLIPVFIPKGMDAEQAIENGKFRPVFDVLKAMQAHDPSMSEVIVKWSELAKGGGTGEVKDDEPLRFVYEGSASMASALSAVVVRGSSVRLGIEWDAQPLGKMTDGALAEMLGVGPTAVAYARAIRGIRPFRRPIEWDAFPVGAVPDSEVAAMAGCKVGSVAYYRWTKGISAFSEPKTCAACGLHLPAVRMKVCSKQCQTRLETIKRREVRNSAVVRCMECNACLPSEVRADKNFCGQSCKGKFQRRKRLESTRVGRICTICSADIPLTRKSPVTCGEKCAAELDRRRRLGHRPDKDGAA